MKTNLINQNALPKRFWQKRKRLEKKKRKRCVLDFRERKHGRVKVPISISNECEAN